MPAAISISPDVLKWVESQCHSLNLPPETQACLQVWLTGAAHPTFKQLEQVSKESGIPLGYFLLQQPPQEAKAELPLFKICAAKRSSSLANEPSQQTPSRALIDVVYHMEQIQDWMRSYLQSEEIEPLAYVGMFNQSSTGEEMAQKICDILQLEDDWYQQASSAEQAFTVLREAISSAGTLVMSGGMALNHPNLALDEHEFRAFTLLDQHAPLIFVNANTPIPSQLLALWHEFAQVCLGEYSLFTENSFAESSLFKATPQLSEVLEKLKPLQAPEPTKAQQTKAQAHASTSPIAYSFDPRFLACLASSVAEGKTLYTDAFRLTCTNRITFTELVELASLQLENRKARQV